MRSVSREVPKTPPSRGSEPETAISPAASGVDASRIEEGKTALSSEAERHPLTPLPPQPGDVPWPADHWPRAELDGRVDRDLLDRTLDHAFAQPESLGTTNAVLIVQRGAIVAERYADGLDATTTHVSWSMAKWQPAQTLHSTSGVTFQGYSA